MQLGRKETFHADSNGPSNGSQRGKQQPQKVFTPKADGHRGSLQGNERESLPEF